MKLILLFLAIVLVPTVIVDARAVRYGWDQVADYASPTCDSTMDATNCRYEGPAKVVSNGEDKYSHLWVTLALDRLGGVENRRIFRSVSPVPETARAVARAVATAFGGKPEVHAHRDADRPHSVDIVACRDRPSPGLVSYSTLTVHLVPNKIDDDDIRVELAGVAEDTVTEFPNLLATAAFYVIKDRWKVGPGIVFPSLLKEYKLSRTLEHLLWVEPFEWTELGSVDVAQGLTVHWLLGVSISESERQYLMDNGYWKFEALMIEREVDYWDLSRRPIV